MLKISAFVVLLFTLQPVASHRGGALAAEPCTVGDAQALFEAGVIPVSVIEPRGSDRPKLLDTSSRCQYQVWRDGETFVFSEDDVFLGGVIWIDDYVQRGVKRQEAIFGLEAIQDRIWLAEVLPGGTVGEWVEQPLMRTAYKNIPTSNFGLVVYQQRGFITQLPPGEYLSFWESSSQGEPIATATVRLVITPAGTAE